MDKTISGTNGVEAPCSKRVLPIRKAKFCLFANSVKNLQ